MHAAIRTPQQVFRHPDDPLATTLQAHPEITAFLAPNDASAHLAYDLFSRLGLRVPDDISLVGFDDTEPLYNAEGDNILTTVRLPLEELGRESARLLIARITRSEPEQREIMLPTELVIRGTTTPPSR